MDEISSFGIWLRRARKAHDLTQADLARQVACSEGTIRSLEADTLRPSKQLAARLAAQLGVPPDAQEALVAFARGAASPPDLPLPPAVPTPSGRSAPERQPAGRPESPPLVRLDVQPSNLPIQPTPLIGREHEVAAVCGLVRRADVRLLTLSGPGGVGKTRLGLQVAAELLADFADGVVFVPLAPIHDPSLVVVALAQALGVKETGQQPLVAQIQGFLRERQLLLLLDNFEQVVEGAGLVAELLAAAVRVKVLVTSRAVLRLRGEREFAVPPLALPERQPRQRLEEYAACALFIQRAQAANPSFQLTEATAPAVADICLRLDGLPLAIELAAARAKLFAPQALLARLSNRLALLTGGARDLPARQQTLRSTIDWSYNLLAEGEQRLFRRLAVFVGGCTLEAADSVCNAPGDLGIDVLDGLAALIDNSLLRQEDGADGEPWFAMLETIREYAWERLAASGELEAIRRQHLLAFVALAERAEPELTGEGQAAWLARLEREHDNVRAALEWARDQGEVTQIARLGSAIWRFWWVHSHLSEGRGWADYILARRGELPGALAARASGVSGTLAYVRGDLAQAIALLEESLELYRPLGDKPGMAIVLSNLGTFVSEQGDHLRAQMLLQESLALNRELGNKHGIAIAVGSLGDIAYDRGEYLQAERYYSESLALAQELGDQHSIAIYLNNLGEMIRYQGDYARATEFYHQSLARFGDLDAQWGVSLSRNGLAHVALHAGDYALAQQYFAENLSFYRDVQDYRLLGVNLAGIAGVAAAKRQPERAARLLGAAEAVVEASMVPLSLAERTDYQGILEDTRAQLDAAAFAAAWAAGRALPLEQAIAEASARRAAARPE